MNEEKFDGDREEVLARMAEHGITRYAVIGSDIATSSACVAYCRTHENAVCAVGIHPHEAKGYREGDLETLAGWIRGGEAQAIGEIGLDYYYDLSPREKQQEVCRAQMELAWELGTAAAFHVRDAHADMLEIMKSMKKHLTPGILHCFSGSAEIAKEYLKLGYMISFAGPVTFNKAPKLLDAAFRERGQKFAYKINPGKQNSPIVFETDGFQIWLAKRIRAAAAERELHMRA